MAYPCLCNMILSTCCSWGCIWEDFFVVALLMFIIFDCHGNKQIPTHHSLLLCWKLFVLWTFTFHSSFLLRLWWHHQHFLNIPHFLSGHLQLPECCSPSRGINKGVECKDLWYICQTCISINHTQTHWRPGGCAEHPACWRTVPAFCSRGKTGTKVVQQWRNDLKIVACYIEIWPQGSAPVQRMAQEFMNLCQPFLCATAGPPLCSSSSQLAAPPVAAHSGQSRPAGNGNNRHIELVMTGLNFWIPSRS